MIRTERLELIPATPGTVRAALEGPEALGAGLSAFVPPTWPPEFLDEDALRWALRKLEAAPEQAEWWFYFVLLPDEEGRRMLIGSAGYKGPPADDGTVEVGYGIVSDRRRRGYAAEAVRGLLARAFGCPEVRRVIAETFPDLVGSLGVLRACGFRPTSESEDASEPGALRFERMRDEG